MMGVANYAECGSNGDITLYMTWFNSAGTPILAEGIGLLAGVIVTLGTQNIFKRKKKIINEA